MPVRPRDSPSSEPRAAPVSPGSATARRDLPALLPFGPQPERRAWRKRGKFGTLLAVVRIADGRPNRGSPRVLFLVAANCGSEQNQSLRVLVPPHGPEYRG